MSEYKESIQYTLYGDLDGMTVAQLRRKLILYPDDAVIDVRSEKVYGQEQEQDFFVFRWEDW
jgi:hypothetical protein